MQPRDAAGVLPKSEKNTRLLVMRDGEETIDPVWAFQTILNEAIAHPDQRFSVAFPYTGAVPPGSALETVLNQV